MNLAIVVQRYGQHIVGGAEAHARRIAHHLSRWHRVTVATTAASDHLAWKNDLPEGEEADGPVRVLRFAVERQRTDYWYALDRLLRGPLGGPDFPGLAPPAKQAFRRRLERWPLGLQEEYIRWQGPYAPALFSWLRENRRSQDRFLFFTYLYPTTYFGVPCVPGEKVDFQPTLHDEPPAYLPAFGRSFHLASRLLFNTDTEQRLSQRLYDAPASKGEVLGYGMDAPAASSGACPATPPFVLYAGRMEDAKGVPLLLQYFMRWKEENGGSRLRLVLVGHSSMRLPDHPAIEYRGFVSEEEKGALMRGALALVHPSPFESLGFILLEAFLCETPALVFARSEVLVDHCRSSHGGLWYEDYYEFAEALGWLLAHPAEAKRLGEQGRAYAQRHYGMDSYTRRLAALYPPQEAAA